MMENYKLLELLLEHRALGQKAIYYTEQDNEQESVKADDKMQEIESTIMSELGLELDSYGNIYKGKQVMNKQENNKLIAEFMGYEPITQNYHDENGFKNDKQMIYDISDCRYRTARDWLMPVVQECYKSDNEELFDELVDSVSTLSIINTYNSVVEFIKANKKESK